MTLDERLVRHIVQLSADEFWKLQAEEKRQLLIQAYCNLLKLEGRLVSVQVTGWITEFEGEKRANYTARSIDLVDVQ